MEKLLRIEITIIFIWGKVTKIAAVVLAAGKSERMCSNKLLLNFGGKRLIDHVLDALDASKVDEIIVVVGSKPWEIVDALKPRLNHIKIAVNERYEEGMTSSFKTGLKQIEHVDAALLVLGDQLILDPKFVDVMIKEMERNRGKASIVSPIYKGKRGHPLLFSKELFNDILNLEQNEMIRDVVHRHSDSHISIDGPKWTVMDVDTPKNFIEATQHLKESAP